MGRQRKIVSALAICAVLAGGLALSSCGGKQRVPAGGGPAAEVSGTSGDADTTTMPSATHPTATAPAATAQRSTAGTTARESTVPATSTR